MNEATQFFNTTGSAGYEIERSLRFNSADSAYLSRTPASAGNRKTWTWAGWVKKGINASQTAFFSAGQNSTNQVDAFEFNSSDQIRIYSYDSAYLFHYITTPVYRDPSAWYHIAVSVDTTQSTSSSRIKIFVNGSQVTSFSTQIDPTQNSDCYWFNGGSLHAIGSTYNNSKFFNGYLADIHFIDGQALDPTSFGEFDTNGVWQPKAYSGSYGTNGFHLPFSDNSTAAALGTDTSGNGNTWTVNNISVAAGAGNDSLVDSPTNYGTDTGAGGEVRGNYATLNPLNANGSTLSNGNLTVVTSTTGGGGRFSGTVAVSSGKWYWEVVASAISSDLLVGIAKSDERLSNEAGFSAGSYSYWSSNGQKYNNSSGSAYGATWTTGDVIGIAFDAGAGTLVFYKNGVSQGTAFSGLSGEFIPVFSPANSTGGTTANVNFGQRPFAYTAPSGFKALCTTNLPDPTIADGSTVMDVKLYTGNATSLTVSGLEFSPDLVWIKQRSTVRSHNLYDTIRGALYVLQSDKTDQEALYSDSLTSFNSDGFSVGSATDVNTPSGGTFAAWCWDAGSSTVTNTQGSITSQVRANASAGFSVVTWTFPASGSFTVGHGLGVSPYLIITKTRSVSNNWNTYHFSTGATGQLRLNTTGAVSTGSTIWNSTSPTSTVFSVGSAYTSAASNATAVAYCFAPVAGYSSFGSYAGNGSADGPFVYTGFRPRWIMIKSLSATANEPWMIQDTARSTANPSNTVLFANFTGGDNTGSFRSVDFLSNGFKLRTSDAGHNSGTDSYIYAAFAEHPFQTSRAR